ncbi:MAG: ATP synthase F1 subunit gamma [Bacteroidales bacterium]|nr:ATP synthase F1 subunit gamma [Bacteroidales bacterium]
MANLKEVRTRIESVNSTKQITSAMKMVAASKLRKSQNAILALRPYAEKFSEIMRNITNGIDSDVSSVYAEERPVERVLIIPISSNKGLCGVFNANVIRSTINLINEEFKDFLESQRLDILCVGSKVEETLKFKKMPVVGNESSLLDNLTYEKAALFAEQLMQMFIEKKYDKIVFVYNQFKNAATQILVTEQFLPINTGTGTSAGTGAGAGMSAGTGVEYIFQPNKEDIYGEMVPKSLKMQVYKILLDSFTSEQGARMLSMTQATDNATELLKELNLTYNKARQSAITNELVEIVSGADAQKN